MSYYANVDAKIRVSTNNIDIVSTIFSAHDFTVDFEESDSCFYYEAYDNYHDDEWDAFADEIAPFIEEGAVEFTGEDDTHWRYTFRKGSYTYECAEITYEPADHYRDLIEQMIEYISESVGDAEEALEVFKGLGFDDDDLDKFGLRPAD